MKKIYRKLSIWIPALLAVAAALTAAALVRARFLPDVEVPVLLYERVENTPTGRYSVSSDLFYAQLRDFSRQGYASVAPWRLPAYKKWGFPLPEKPLLITFDRACRDLPAVAGQFLDDQKFSATVLLATSLITNEALNRRMTLEGAEMMTWEEVRKLNGAGVFTFGGNTRSRADLTLSENPRNEIRASRSDIKKNLGERNNTFAYPFGKHNAETAKAAKRAKIDIAMTYGNTVAQIGPKTDMLAIPRIRVVGGRQVFAVEAVESRSREAFGFATVARQSGPAFPARVSVFYGADPQAVAEQNVELREAETFKIALPYPASDTIAAMWPMRVEIRDATGVLLYLSVEIKSQSVIRTPGAGVNISGEIELDDLKLE